MNQLKETNKLVVAALTFFFIVSLYGGFFYHKQIIKELNLNWYLKDTVKTEVLLMDNTFMQAQQKINEQKYRQAVEIFNDYFRSPEHRKFYTQNYPDNTIQVFDREFERLKFFAKD